jgi:hypothetical protein
MTCVSPRISLVKKHLGHSILRQVHILIIPYILFWTWQELYFQNFYLNMQYLSNIGFTFFLLLAVWLLCEGLQHFWDFIVVLLVVLSAALTVVKIYIIIAVSFIIHYKNCDCYSNKDKLILGEKTCYSKQNIHFVIPLLQINKILQNIKKYSVPLFYLL